MIKNIIAERDWICASILSALARAFKRASVNTQTHSCKRFLKISRLQRKLSAGCVNFDACQQMVALLLHDYQTI
jgi:hypothetical protein